MGKANGSSGTFSWAGNPIENVKSASLDLSTVAVDSTCNDDAGDKSYLVGDRDGTCSVTCNYDPAETAQLALITDFHAGNTQTCVWTPAAGKTYTFTGLITGLSIPAAHDTTVEMTVSFQITGGVTVA